MIMPITAKQPDLHSRYHVLPEEHIFKKVLDECHPHTLVDNYRKFIRDFVKKSAWPDYYNTRSE